jgi:hypothetical protein
MKDNFWLITFTQPITPLGLTYLLVPNNPEYIKVVVGTSGESKGVIG